MSGEYEIYKTFKVVNGEIQGLARNTLKKELAYFEDMNCEMIIRKRKKHRSTLQNNLMWMYNKMIGDYLGYTKDEMHSEIKPIFLTYEKVDEKTGAIHKFVKRTRDLSTVEMMEYLINMQRWAAEQGCILPDPVSQLSMPIQ